jgi:hypothetical protein
MALVRERAIPTEQPPLVGEVSANLFLRIEVATWYIRGVPCLKFDRNDNVSNEALHSPLSALNLQNEQ